MPKPAGASIIALTVILLGVATAVVGSFGSMWAIATPDLSLGLKIALPALTTWLVVSLITLVVALRRGAKADNWIDPLSALKSAARQTPDSAMRAVWPEASFYQEVPLPPDAGTPHLPWRRKVAMKITMRDEKHRYLVMWRGRSSATCIPAHIRP